MVLRFRRAKAYREPPPASSGVPVAGWSRHFPEWQPAEVRAASSRESVVVSFARRSHSRESGNLLPKPLEMRCRRTGFFPPWRDGNDRRLEWIPIPNDTKTQEPATGVRKRDRRCITCCNKCFEYMLRDDGFPVNIHRTNEIPQR